MINKVANLTKWKKWFLIFGVVLSYALLKSFNPILNYSTENILLSVLMVVGTGVFYWLVFEILVSFFYSGLKNKIEKNITMNQFLNIFRLFIIPINLINYLLIKLILLINFYPIYLIMIFSVIFMFFAMFFVYKIIAKNYLINLINRDFEISYFSFIFVYLFLQTIMWGAL